ncbi:MAG: hypothetical protein ACLU9S_14595 [Oscillospiraceae bacterium]
MYAMMQEIAAFAGNFCGVCPVIGRLNDPVCACVYRCAYGNRPARVGHFSWRGNDTHGGADSEVSTVPSHNN